IACEATEGVPDADRGPFDASGRSPRPGRAEKHQRLRPSAAREFDTDPAAERVSGEVHFFEAHAIELRLDAVDEGFNRWRNLGIQCWSAGVPMQRRDDHV